MQKYELIIYWSAEDAVYVAEVSGRHALGKDGRAGGGRRWKHIKWQWPCFICRQAISG